MRTHLLITKLFFLVATFMLSSTLYFGGSFVASEINQSDKRSMFAYLNNTDIEYLPTQVLGKNTVEASSIPILLYHGIAEKPNGEDIDFQTFKEQMFALKQIGYETVTISELNDYLKGKAPLPAKSFLLTFDDGRKDSYYPVDPVLKTLNYEAVLFIITKYSLSENYHNYYLSKNELRQMLKSGRWEIQPHAGEGHDMELKVAADGTKGHYYSNKLWLDNQNRLETAEEYVERITNDIKSAKADTEQELGIEVVGFAYPFGDYGQSSINYPESESIVRDIVTSYYPLSFYQVWAGGEFSVNYPQEGLSLIKRIEVRPGWSSTDLVKVLEVVQDKTLPFTDNFDDYTGWVKKWGNITLSYNELTLGATPTTTSGLLFLEGTYLWNDYTFQSDVSLVRGQSFSILARFKDDQNYVSCSYSPSGIMLETTVYGQKEVIVESNDFFDSKFTKNNVAIKVEGNSVACYLNDQQVLSASDSNDTLKSGGVGFHSWDPNTNNSEIRISNVRIR